MLRGIRSKEVILDVKNISPIYFNMALRKEWGLPVVLWLDYDENKNKEVLSHTFNVLGGSVYIDTLGFFQDIDSRLSKIPHSFVNLELYRSDNDIKNLKEKLKELEIEHT